MAAATDELTLLERVFLRIGSAESDDALQNAVSKFLPPVLLKLSSQQEGVRKKVMELLVHINKRIKSRPKVQLPVEALLLQYQDPAATSFVTNFTIIYIKMGYPRMEMSKQAELLPCVLNCLEGKPQSHQDSLLLMVMPVFAHVKVPSDPQKQSAMFGLQERPAVAKLLLDFMLDLLLLPYGAAPPPRAQMQSGSNNTLTIPPGMSEYSFKRVMGESPMKAEDLEQTKVGIVKFLSSGVLPETDIICHMVVAASDTRFAVASAGDMELKRIAGNSEWSNTAVITKLYSIFLGTVVSKEKVNVKPELKRSPASTRIRLRILPYLVRSREAAMQFPSCIQVVFDSLYGTNTNTKMKDKALQFVMQIVQVCPESRVSPIGGVLMSGLLKLIAQSKEEPQLRSMAYIAIGKLGLKLPHLVTKDMALLQTFFEALTQEGKETQQAVQQSLSFMAPAFCQLEPANQRIMEALVTTSIDKPESVVRLVAVKYAATVFPTTHVPSRFVLLLAAGDSAEEVVAEAVKSLYGSLKSRHEQDESSVAPALPSFDNMASYIWEKASSPQGKQSYSVGSQVLPFSPGTCSETLTFLRLCLAQSAKISVKSKEAGYTIKENAPMVGSYLCHLIVENKTVVTGFLCLIEMLLKTNAGPTALACLLECVACVPDMLAPAYVNKLDWLKGFLASSKMEVREISAELFGVVTSVSLNGDEFNQVVKDLVTVAEGKSLEAQHGSILALGYSLGRKALRELRGNNANLLKWQMYKDGVDCIVSHLNHQHALPIGAACMAVNEVGRFGPLPLPSVAENETSENALKGKLGVAKRLLQITRDTKLPSKLRERAALAAGSLCIGDPEFPHCHTIIQGFLDLPRDIKDMEIYFTIGEALVFCVLGPMSPAGRDYWITTEEDYIPAVADKYSSKELSWLLQELLEKHVRNSHPNIKQASSIWLLSLVKRCSNCVEVKARLEDLQAAFLNLLSDTNDMIQDVASKGLGLVYECSSDEQQSKLVATLVETLSKGQKPAQQVTADTKLFEDGSLGKSPTGELCSLASDLNQPDLIYKFMHLANHNAIWNSKRGAAFGFSTIAAKAGEQLTHHLPQIIPRLYRYQFDPTPRVQQAMNSIWSALVTEPQKIVTTYFHEILADIAENITNSQWRIRESSCLALSDLIQGRSLDGEIEVIPGLWESLFRVQDDVKESVRKAAESALKMLSRVCIRMCEANSGKSGQLSIQSVLPILLKTGLCSTVPEVRTVSLQTLSQVAKIAGPLLKPHLPLLLVALLEATGQTESAALNYLSTRLGTEQKAQESFDMARIAASKTTPMMDTVQNSLQYVDGSTLEELIPRLLELMRNSVGIGTKAGCMHVVVFLTHHCPQDLQPYSGKILAALVHCLANRNAAIRRNSAIAISYVVRTAKDTSVEKLFIKLRSWYMERDEDNIQSSCVYTLQAIVRNSPDIMNAHAAQALPLAFLAKHGAPIKIGEKEGEGYHKIWEEIWIDSTPGTEGGLRLYLTEILEVLKLALESQSWNRKAQAARSMGTIASTLKSDLDPAHQSSILEFLVGGLSGRTWTGKESLLKAIEEICVNCKDTLPSVLPVDGQNGEFTQMKVVEAVLKECRKENLVYKRHALQAAGHILEALEIDKFSELYDIVTPLLAKDANGNSKANEQFSDDIDEDHLLLTLEAAFAALGSAWPKTCESQDKHCATLLNLLSTSLSSNTRPIQLAIVVTLGKVVSRWLPLHRDGEVVSEATQMAAVLEAVGKILSEVFGMTKFSKIKKEGLAVLENVINILKEMDQLDQAVKLGDSVKKGMLDLCDDGQPEVCEVARRIKSNWE